jgi:hypothetical protein
VDEDTKDFYKPSILASSFEGEFTGESYVVIIQIKKPKRVREAFEEELEKLADILINGNNRSSLSIGLASSGDLSFPFTIAG